jgi:PAS domain S-box-containing protein
MAEVRTEVGSDESTARAPVIRVPGYDVVARLGRTAGSLLVRARRHDDRALVLLKLLEVDAPGPGPTGRLRREHQILESLDGVGVPRPLALITVGPRPAIVLADDGELLEAVLAAPLPLARALRLGRELALALAALHDARLVHRDLRPINVLVGPDADRVRLVDLSQAGPPSAAAEELPHDDLAYIAPEQTGRLALAVDTRADLYALGVVLYRMIAGALPYHASDPLEWVHCHVARVPVPLAVATPGAPPVVSDLVARLLAKSPGDRYQSARGVAADLARCAASWEAGGAIERFALGASDLADRIELPHRLHGREDELALLLSAFDRVAAGGPAEVALIAGHSGVGKSSLVHELQRRAVAAGGLCIAGKFDQGRRDVPYATFAQAFRTLMQQLLSGREDELDAWRHRLREALGGNAQAVVAVLPELELVIGTQPPAPAVGLAEAQVRFHAVFRQFVGVFARREHPLVIFVDDLQWLDPAGRMLLEDLATHGDRSSLLMVGAYRSDEVSPAHPLAATIGAIRTSGTRVSEIALGALAPGALARLLGDALHADSDAVAPLAALVRDRTGGNPFFAIQLVSALHEEGLIALDRSAGAFRWDLAEIRARDVTDDVVDLMVGKLRRLPEATRQVIAELACLGHGADIAVLAIVHGASEADTHAALREAVAAGMVLASGGGYHFVHDRVEEASYLLVPADRRGEAHLRIGRRLTARLTESEIAERIFDVAGQWNRGLEAVVDPAERATALRLNVQAGTRARAAAAYASACEYLARAARLLPGDAWSAAYGDTLALHLQLAECESLVGSYPRAEERLTVALDHVRDRVDVAQVLRLRIRLRQLAGRQDEAVAVMLTGLQRLGVTFPDTDDAVAATVRADLARIRALLAGRRIADLADAPLASDPDVHAIIGLLDEGAAPTYTARPALWPALPARSTLLSLEHGNTESSPFAYLGAALLLVSIAGEVEAAFELSAMSLRLNERFDRTRVALRGKMLFHHAAMVQVWRQPVAVALPSVEEAFRACVDVGDLVFAGYMTYNLVWLLFESGAPLDQVVARTHGYAAFAGQRHNDIVQRVLELQERFAAGLVADGSAGEPRGDEASLAALARGGFTVGIAYFHVMQQIAAFLGGRAAEALDHAGRAAAVLPAVRTLLVEAAHHFFLGLSAGALHADAAPERQAELAAVVADQVQRHQRWAASCPETFGARHALLSAELARLEGRLVDAELGYEEAIHGAREHGFVQYQAVAWETAARFYRGRGLDTIADAYLREARACYAAWGAGAKVAALDRAAARVDPAPPAPGAAARGESLDLVTVIRASQAISQPIVLDDLITTLMRVVLESAGAQAAALLLARGDREPLRLAAIARVEGTEVMVRRHDEVPSASDLPLSLLAYVRRSREHVLLGDATRPSPFATDRYLVSRAPRSVLALPILRQSELVGALYLENALVADAFTPDRVAMLTVLAGQAAISLDNARLYSDLQHENGERRQAEAALTSSQALLQAVVDSSPTAIYVKDLDGRFLLLNQRVADAAGSDRAALLGKTDHEVFPHAQADAFRALDQRVLAAGTALEAEEIVPEGDGLHTYLSVKTPLVDPSGRPYAVCSVSTDITARKRAEAALRRTEEQLRQAQKMEAIGKLAGGVAHDFNNLLSVILSYSSMLAQDMTASDPRRSDLEEIEAAGHRAVDLTRQLLAFGRKQILQPKIVDLDEVVVGMERMLRRLIGEDIELTVLTAHPLDAVRVDRGQIEQIIMNLAVNARDAMPRGGKLTIETANVILDERYASEHVGVVCGAHVMLAVTDNGAGMDAATLEHMFEPFFTTKERGKGTGLGLATVFGIVQQSGGNIWVYSEVGKGTTFKIYLPRATTDGAPAIDRPPAVLQSTVGTETILLVEDDESVRVLARNILERAGYHVLEAPSGGDALLICEQHTATIHLLLTDVVMPRLSGRQLAERLHTLRPDMKVLFMSGYTDNAIVHHGVLDSDVAFLQKPITPDALTYRVRCVLDS